MKDAEIDSLGCADHNINLSINDIVFSQRAVKDVLAKGRKIAGHFNHSSKACDRLMALQDQLGQKRLKIAQDVVTRWNSTMYMAESLLKSQGAVAQYIQETPTLPELSRHEWGLLASVVELLGPLEKLTRVRERGRKG